MIGCPHWPPTRRPQGRRDRDRGRHLSGTRGEERNLDDPNRLRGRRRPGRARPGRQFRPAGRQPHRLRLLAIELMPKRLELLSELVPQAK